MRKIFTSIIVFLILFLLNSCSNNDEKEDTNSIIPEGLIVTANGITRTYKVKVEEFVEEKGTANEYTNLVVSGRIENSDERIFFSLTKGKIGSNALYHLLYVNDKNEGHYYDNITGQGEVRYDFSTNTLLNNFDKKLEGRFSGKLNTNQKGTSTQLKGTFNIQY